MKNLIKSVFFVLTTILLLTGLSAVLQMKSKTPVMKEFYRQDKNEIQVVALGTSHINRALSPMYMYENHGITSYTFGTGNQLPESGYHILVEVYKRQKPEVVILETGNFFYADPTKGSKNMSLLEQFRFSENRLDLARDIAEYGDSPYRDTLTSFIPLYTYHSRWNELTERDWHIFENDNRTKGQYITGDIYDGDVYAERGLVKDDESESTVISEQNLGFIRKISRLCNENGSRLILVTTPSVYWTEEKENEVTKLAEELGVDYLNTFFTPDGIFDYGKDMSDHNHLNSRGAEKFTDYIADYLEEKCGVTGSGNCEDYDEAVPFFDRYKEYYDIKLETDCIGYLDMITSSKEKYAYAVSIREDEYRELNSDVKAKLLELGIDGNFEEGSVYTAFFDGGNPVMSDYRAYDTEFSFDAGRYGEISLLNEDSMPKKYSFRDTVIGNSGGLNILLFERESGEKFDYVTFRCDSGEMCSFRKNPDDETDNDELMLYRRWLLKHQ